MQNREAHTSAAFDDELCEAAAAAAAAAEVVDVDIDDDDDASSGFECGDSVARLCDPIVIVAPRLLKSTTTTNTSDCLDGVV